MVSTSREKQQKRMFFGPLNETTEFFHLRKKIRSIRNATQVGRADEKIASGTLNHLTPDVNSQVNLQLIEKNYSDRLRCEEDRVVTMAKLSVLGVSLASTDNLVIPTEELALMLAKASSTRNSDSVVFDLDQKDFQEIQKAQI